MFELNYECKSNPGLYSLLKTERSLCTTNAQFPLFGEIYLVPFICIFFVLIFEQSKSIMLIQWFVFIVCEQQGQAEDTAC